MHYKSLKKAKNSITTFCIAIIIITAISAQADDKKWATTIYGAVQADNDFDAMFFKPQFDGNYKLIVVALSRKIGSLTEHLQFELEGQAGKHFGDQSHMEFNGLIIARWLTFPWNKHLKTSFAVGEGLSLATEIPKFEALHHEKTNQLLDYLLVETALSLPQTPQWSFVWRIHHRSGVYGLFNGVDGASNAMGVGLRYSF